MYLSYCRLTLGVSSLGLMLLTTFSHMSFDEPRYARSHSVGIADQFSWIILPPIMYERDSCSTASPTPAVVRFSFGFSHTGRCVMVSQCGFNVNSPDNQRCWTHFHIHSGLWAILFCRVPAPIFCHRFNCVWTLKLIFKSCNGLDCVPAKCVCWNPNPRMTILETRPLGRWTK